MTWLDALTNDARCHDQLRVAERERLASLARQPDRAIFRLNFARPVVSWLGRRLVTLGFRLLIASKEWDTRAKTVYNGLEWS